LAPYLNFLQKMCAGAGIFNFSVPTTEKYLNPETLSGYCVSSSWLT